MGGPHGDPMGGPHGGPLGALMGRNCPQKAPLWPPWALHGAELLPKGVTWAPWAPMGRICLQALQGVCCVPRRGVFSCKKTTFLDFWSKNCQKKVEIEGGRPIWRDPQRNSVQNPASDVQNGGMATHFKPNWCHFGSLGVPAPASTPFGSWPKTKGAVEDHLVTTVSAGTK